MSRYENTKVNINKYGVKSNGTTIYIEIPERDDDIWIISQSGDRLDNLAFQFYGDQNLWWYIAKANDINTMNIPAGTSLRIPLSPDAATGG